MEEKDSRRWKPIVDASLPAPAGAYSPAVRAGNLIFVSGQVPRDPVTGELVGTDIATQSRQVLKNLSDILSAAGASFSDVVAATVFLADEGDWAAFNEIYKATFSAPYPARTVVGAQLRGGFLVEVNAIAVAA
jgi:2-iminobutanoate/2-iminopropanoate deaminase